MRTAQNSPGTTAFWPARLPGLISVWFGPKIPPQTQTAPMVLVARRTNPWWGARCSAAEVLYLSQAEQRPRTTSAQALGLLNFCLVNTKIAFQLINTNHHQPPPQRREFSTTRHHHRDRASLDGILQIHLFFQLLSKPIVPRALVCIASQQWPAEKANPRGARAPAARRLGLTAQRNSRATRPAPACRYVKSLIRLSVTNTRGCCCDAKRIEAAAWERPATTRLGRTFLSKPVFSTTTQIFRRCCDFNHSCGPLQVNRADFCTPGDAGRLGGPASISPSTACHVA